MSGLAAFLLLTAQATAEPVDLSPAQLSRGLEDWDGRVVRIRGWLECGTWGCDLRSRRMQGGGSSASVSIGDNAGLTPSLADAAGHEVVIEGRATAECRREVCTDHGPELMPTRIVRIFGAPRAAVKDR